MRTTGVALLALMPGATCIDAQVETRDPVPVPVIADHRTSKQISVCTQSSDAFLEDDPDTYYLKEHYLNYRCVLVRLSRARADALRDLIAGACHFVSAQVGTTRAGRCHRPGVDR